MPGWTSRHRDQILPVQKSSQSLNDSAQQQEIHCESETRQAYVGASDGLAADVAAVALPVAIPAVTEAAVETVWRIQRGFPWWCASALRIPHLLCKLQSFALLLIERKRGANGERHKNLRNAKEQRII